MKWFSLVIVVMVGAVIVWTMFYRGSPEGTPYAVAEAYTEAALAGDEEKIKSLCTESAAATALQVARQIRQADPDPMSIAFKRMSADPPRTGLMWMFRGRMLGIELLKENEDWKIVHTGLSDQ